VRTSDEAFDRYLARGRSAYFERFRLEPEETIALIAEAGGVTVLAHPYYMGLSFDLVTATLARLKGAGLVGVEAYYTEHTEEETRLYVAIANRLGLLVTGGSDFHGTIKPDIALGWGRGSLRVPYALFERLVEALQRRGWNPPA
jgi:predicted metal-dependent phosphoesterase TrpH